MHFSGWADVLLFSIISLLLNNISHARGNAFDYALGQLQLGITHSNDIHDD